MRPTLAACLLTSFCLTAPAAEAEKTYNTDKGILTGLALSADGRLLAVAGDMRETKIIDGRRTNFIKGGELTIWDTRGAKKLCTVPLRSNLTQSLRFSPDGARLAIAGPGSVMVLDSATGKEQ